MDPPDPAPEPRTLAAVLDDQFEVRALYPVGFVEALQAQVVRQYEAIERASSWLALVDPDLIARIVAMIEARGESEVAGRFSAIGKVIRRAADALAAANPQGGSDD